MTLCRDQAEFRLVTILREFHISRLLPMQSLYAYPQQMAETC